MPNKTRLTANKLCARCLRHCKQEPGVLLLECPRFLVRPFKSPEYSFDQLDLFGGGDATE